MLVIMLLIGWRELELLERIQFVNEQEGGKGEVGVEHIKINES